ncbi:retinol dehydrogenase 13-like isoform X1 [Daphnia carinata]|uniref:retinol dehydrogenase 13-like isoform X1 n=1 Tax=Daphnia carinata TaxID=120202 RepID=UPI00257EFA81|nr:retinol dehydrogenase 13-like isoform X1 [Daphnia carinata]
MLTFLCSLPILWQIGLLISLLLGGFKAYLWYTLGVCTSTKKMSGKTVIITGANTGIGKETAIDLAKRGARVILACRDPKKAAIAKDDIIQETGNKNVVVRHLDLASLKSVRKFAAEILKSEPRLDILINNAGCATIEKKLTEDGLEYQMQSNHFGHFLLTNLLLGLIIKTGTARIINVSSEAHRMPNRLNLDDLTFDRDPADSKILRIYGVTKLCNILFSKELARKLEPCGKNITVNSLHPGVVHTEFGRFLPYEVFKKIMTAISPLFSKSAKEGAQTTIYLAVADEVANVSGKYFCDCKIAKTSKLAKDAGLAKKLWEVSETLVKLKPEERHY